MYAAKQLVLIVEDDAEIRRSMRRLLRSFGYRVVEAADCAEARELTRAETPDAVVTDVELPTISDLQRCFADDEALRRVPLVIVDGDAETLQPLDGVTVIHSFDNLAPLLFTLHADDARSEPASNRSVELRG